MKSIRARLLLALLLGTLCCTLAAAYLLYRLADNEADDQSDLRLRQLAWAMPLQLRAGGAAAPRPGPDDALLVQVWRSDGVAAYLSDPALALPPQRDAGYHTISWQGQRWRVYTERRAGYLVQIAQPVAVRQRGAARMVLRILPALLLLLPALGIMIWVVVGRALRPLERVAHGLRHRSPQALQALDGAGLSPELGAIVESINGLLEKIALAMAAQRSFVADAAHELRSPLTALKLQLQLAERCEDGAARAVSFGKLHERLDRATHLVRQLLTMARLEPSQLPPQRLPCELQALAQAVVAGHAILAEHRDIDLGLADAGAPLTVAAHAEGLAVMLSNLVDNALRYTQRGGRVDVSVGTAQGRPYLRVADNGPGVPEGERARLFDRFYRPDGNAVWGCGLGLSIVRNVADAHGAQIELASPAAGGGLVVTVTLPPR